MSIMNSLWHTFFLLKKQCKRERMMKSNNFYIKIKSMNID